MLCSSFLSSKGLRLDSDPAKVRELESQLTELSHSIIAVLSLALQVSCNAKRPAESRCVIYFTHQSASVE